MVNSAEGTGRVMEPTEGPWRQRGDDSVCVVDMNGNAICYTDTFLPKEQCVANARLIASAPDLLDEARSIDHGYDWILSQLTDFRLYQGSWSLENGDSWAASLVANIKSHQIGTKAVIERAEAKS